jgi:hypothetical protein
MPCAQAGAARNHHEETGKGNLIILDPPGYTPCDVPSEPTAFNPEMQRFDSTMERCRRSLDA